VRKLQGTGGKKVDFALTLRALRSHSLAKDGHRHHEQYQGKNSLLREGSGVLMEGCDAQKWKSRY